GSIAAAEAEGLLAGLGELRLELARRAAILHADYVLVHEALRINAEHADLLQDLLRVATDRYVAGLASQQDPLHAESELAHRMHDDVVLRTERAVVASRINSLLHRPPDAVLPPPAAEEPALAESELGVGSALHGAAQAEVAPIGAAEHEQEALASRPELRAREASTRAREAELELARLSGRPDFGVMSSYSSMWAEREHRYMVGGSVSLPIRRSRVRAGIAEAEARLAQARSERTAMEDEVRREVRESMERLRESHHVLELYESRLRPVARDRVDAALAGFQASKNDFLALIEAERNLRDVELGYQRARAGLAREQVELERALGRGVAAAETSNETASGRSEASGDEP
ncbi:MAG TPA: TolC family protein, partial [Thermoanaerobaculia bacterium]|nr:TolC family protein [Thermoanaerobaculia bacterium]